jgi:hypothetical protein
LPSARDSLYFVGVCSDLPSYQEALSCARTEALTDVAAWVGARLSTYVYSAQSEGRRAGSAGAYFEGDLFLSEVRRSETYYEVRKEDWGRSYRVAVVYAYPRDEAEAEKARIEATTVGAQRQVDGAALALSLLAAEGQWGEAMDRLVGLAGDVSVPGNLGRDAHLQRLERVADELVRPLRLSARVVEQGPKARVVVWVDATYDSVAAAGVPITCARGSETTSAVTDDAGLAVCRLVAAAAAEASEVIVRPDVRAYLDRLPDTASRLAAALGALLDHRDTARIAAPLTARVSLTGGGDCRRTLDLLRGRLELSGVSVVARAEGVTDFSIACTVGAAQQVGDLYEAYAWASVGSAVRTVDLPTQRGLGGSPAAARSEAEERLAAAVTRVIVQVLREIEGR